MKSKSNKVFLIIFVVIIFIMGISLINANRRSGLSEATITVVSDAAEGLDLKALGELVKGARSAEDLETKLNKPEGINNLDLNEDGKVDFIGVAEYGNKADSAEAASGFSLTVDVADGETQEIASVEISKSGDQAEVEVRGNEQIYGRNHYYYGYHPVGSFLLASYLFRPHPYYVSSYGWGRYPGYYGGGYAPVGASAYRTRTAGVTKGSTLTQASASKMTSKTGLTNPNTGKTANKAITQRLRSPTATQKSFQARNPSKATRTGGFGKSTSVRSTSRSRSSGGFGK